MKHLTLALITAAACMSIPLSSYAAGTMPPMFDWSGPYAGAQLGYGFGHDFFKQNNGLRSKTATLDGLIVGGTAGYNMMMNSNIVLGIEGDFAFSGISSSAGYGTTGCGGGCHLDIGWFGTARARLGYAMGDTMPYLIGGVAVAGLDAYPGQSVFSPGYSYTRKAKAGWTAGGGIEHAFSNSVTGKIEYLYTDLGQLGITPTVHTNVKFSLVRVGVNFHF